MKKKTIDEEVEEIKAEMTPSTEHPFVQEQHRLMRERAAEVERLSKEGNHFGQ